jgi:catechol 2,3-dioxygenase
VTLPAGPANVPQAPSRHRLPADTRVGAVRLQVGDLERSLRYYEQVIGLAVRDRQADVARLAAATGPILVELHERAGAAPVPRRGRFGLYHYAMLLPNRPALGRFVKHLDALGIRAGMSDHLVSEAIYLADPDGLGIELYADRPRETWRYDRGQLVMDTRPLNVNDLTIAAGREAWDGPPDGTVIGHIHLHVGDLERAEAFYHAGLGLDKTVWSYPGALFLSAGGYHHHLGVNTWAEGASPAGPGDARLLEWELVLPTADAARTALSSVAVGGAAIELTSDGGVALDPWGTAVRLVGNH